MILFQKSDKKLTNDHKLLFYFPLSILHTVLLIAFHSSLTLKVSEASFKVREKLCGKELVDSRMKKGPAYSARMTSSSSTNSFTAKTRGRNNVAIIVPLGELASYVTATITTRNLTLSPQSRGTVLRVLLFCV